jgi:hypothetical protein
VLQLYAQGYTVWQVDSLLGGQTDVERLLRNAARALGVATAAQAVAEAQRRRLIL